MAKKDDKDEIDFDLEDDEMEIDGADESDMHDDGVNYEDPDLEDDEISDDLFDKEESEEDVDISDDEFEPEIIEIEEPIKEINTKGKTMRTAKKAAKKSKAPARSGVKKSAAPKDLAKTTKTNRPAKEPKERSKPAPTKVFALRMDESVISQIKESGLDIAKVFKAFCEEKIIKDKKCPTCGHKI